MHLFALRSAVLSARVLLKSPPTHMDTREVHVKVREVEHETIIRAFLGVCVHHLIPIIRLQVVFSFDEFGDRAASQRLARTFDGQRLRLIRPDLARISPVVFCNVFFESQLERRYRPRRRRSGSRPNFPLNEMSRLCLVGSIDCKSLARRAWRRRQTLTLRLRRASGLLSARHRVSSNCDRFRCRARKQHSAMFGG